MQSTLAELRECIPQVGQLQGIGLRPERKTPIKVVEEARVILGKGLEGDRFSGKAQSTRQITLIQEEHLAAVASILGLEALDPWAMRRNLVVSGINLLSLKGMRFAIGEVVLEGTGLCHPCSRMEEVLGPGGYNAMRGHGGITAKVIKEGTIRVGDAIRYMEVVPS